MACGPPGDSDVQHALPVTFDTGEDLGYPCRDSETAGHGGPEGEGKAMGGVPQVGAEFAGYRIEGLLGRGGGGIVFLALDPRLQRRVALKILADEVSQDEYVRERFAREPRLAASIDHPHIIPIYEAGESDGSLFIAMRHVEGCDLGSLVNREGPLDAERAIAIVAQVGSALDAAHARGLYHRDVKPANILVVLRADPQGTDHAYLADFGITKSASTRGVTRTGQYLGTLDYAAPEQIRGEGIDGRTDIYALGCVLFQSLTGLPPFPRDGDAARMYAHLSEDPPLVSARRSDLPVALDEVVVTAMAKDPEQRYASGADMAAAARGALRGARRRRRTSTPAPTTVIARPRASAPVTPEPVAPAPPRWSQRLVIGGAGFLIALSFIGLLTHRSATAVVPASSTTTAAPSAAAEGPFPTPQEKALQARFPDFVLGCHRYSHFDKVVAGIECQVASDFPGATSLIYQQFANYADLEEFFHTEKFLPPSYQGTQPPQGLCVDSGPAFYAYSNYNTDREAQTEPTAHGHLFCYRINGVPKLAWTNVGNLIVARAVGSVTDPQAPSRLVGFWTNAGPLGAAAAPSGTPESQVRSLYQRYLLREPESDQALQFWAGRLATDGFAQVSNQIADSSEARTRFTLPLLHPPVTPVGP
jgi:serine/threonine-protein kinase